MTLNPFGPEIDSFDSVADFYTAHPDVAKGWSIEQRKPAEPPFGPDLSSEGEWSLVVAVPGLESRKHDTRDMRGLPLAFNHVTQKVLVLGGPMLVKDVEDRFM